MLSEWADSESSTDVLNTKTDASGGRTGYKYVLSVAVLKWYFILLIKCFFFSISKVETAVTDNSDGSYSVSYTPQEPGAYSVWVCVKAQHVKVF